MEKISVIIPVFNAQDTINQTVDSIKAQTYKDWEIILVNDGSTDDSLEICKSLENERIHVIDKKNGGAVSAYKKGIQNATCDLIAFCDADDRYKPDYLERAMKIMQEQNCDFVTFGCSIIESNKETIGKNAALEGFYDKERIQKEILTHCLFNDYIPGSYYSISVYRVTKVFRKELVMRFVDQLDENCSQLEDNIFTTLTILNAQSFFVDNHSVYDYLIRPQSMSSHCSENLIDKYIYSLSVIKKLADKYLADYNPKQFNFLAYENFRICFRRIAKVSDYKTARKAIQKMRESGWIDCVKFGEIRLLKNYLFYFLYHCRINFLLYICFKYL